jgi:hypothetical protein
MRAPLPSLSISDADLARMSDGELADLEDRLLLDSELDLSPGAQFTRGRIVVWILTVIGIVVALGLYSRLPTERLGPLNIPLYLLALGLGGAAAHLLWSAVPRRARELVRWLLGHWPVVLYLVATLYRLTRHS